MDEKLKYIPDKELVDMFFNGDNSAFEVILLRHKNRVFTYIYNLVKESNLADDIFQDTFIKVIDTIKSGKYNDEGKFLSWVLRIAHNKVIDHYRFLAADRTINNEDSGVDLFSKLDLCDDAHQEYWEYETTLRKVEHFITLLPVDQQRVVLLRYFRELSYKEIADIEDISINTALGRMRYALLNMRKMMSKPGAFVPGV